MPGGRRGLLLDHAHGSRPPGALRRHAGPVTKDIVFDHVAIATERWSDAWPRLAGDLGGRWASGGYALGYAPMQLRYANGMKIELLEPHDVERNDFLRRFLDRHGPGPHHFTFKVPDISVMLDTLDANGFPPVNV